MPGYPLSAETAGAPLPVPPCIVGGRGRGGRRKREPTPVTASRHSPRTEADHRPQGPLTSVRRLPLAKKSQTRDGQKRKSRQVRHPCFWPWRGPCRSAPQSHDSSLRVGGPHRCGQSPQERRRAPPPRRRGGNRGATPWPTVPRQHQRQESAMTRRKLSCGVHEKGRTGTQAVPVQWKTAHFP